MYKVNPIKGFKFIFKERTYVSQGIWSDDTFDYADKETGGNWNTTLRKFNELIREGQITILGN